MYTFCQDGSSAIACNQAICCNDNDMKFILKYKIAIFLMHTLHMKSLILFQDFLNENSNSNRNKS